MTSKGKFAPAAHLRWRLLKPLLEKTGLIGPIFRRMERRVARKAVPTFRDGRPMPPPDLLVAVSGTPGQAEFSGSGRYCAQLFRNLAGQHGVDMAAGSVVLDFGCGCGRIARWLAPDVIAGGGRFLGFDHNPSLVNWCAANLPGEYAANDLNPPLRCASGVVDMLYAYSVFTHLREATTVRWLEEIARVLRPGGLALLTFHDETFADIFGIPEVQAGLARRGYFVLNDALEGSNYISAWITRGYFSALASDQYEVLDLHPGREDMIQAIAVLRKR